MDKCLLDLPILYPVEVRRLLVECFSFWFSSASKKRAYALRGEAANPGRFKSKPAAPSSMTASA